MQGLAARHHDHKGGRTFKLQSTLVSPEGCAAPTCPVGSKSNAAIGEGVFDNAKRFGVRLYEDR